MFKPPIAPISEIKFINYDVSPPPYGTCVNNTVFRMSPQNMGFNEIMPIGSPYLYGNPRPAMVQRQGGIYFSPITQYTDTIIQPQQFSHNNQ